MISYSEEKQIFDLHTDHTSYLIALSPDGYVGHLYYGKRIRNAVSAELLRAHQHPFSPSVNLREKQSFLDCFPMEYAGSGVGDFRESCIKVRDPWGSMACDPIYAGHRIFAGKKKLEGLPASFGTEEEVDTLEIDLKDEVTGIVITLSYSVFAKEDVITRSVLVTNGGTQPYRLEKVYSACLDMDNQNFEVISLHGAWARERHIQRMPLGFGRYNVGSFRGETSHQEHPFLALVTPGTNQEQGQVYAMNFVYSGNFLAQAELSQHGQVRMTMGIHSEEFCWYLAPGDTFQAPEVVMTYSGSGLGTMTRQFHRFYREHMIRSPYRNTKRPILINNWEATYFDFDTEKLIAIAREAAKRGIEMLVMDDGWFGHRSSDDSSLGDWIVNEEKLPGGLSYLVQEVNKLGLKFGIWFEPEMISPDSILYRTHPEWAIRIPGRTATLGRCQYVLDLSRPEVRDYVYESVASVLRSANIEYVKWDMNRQLTDLGSAYLDSDSQRELSHRYVLGVYELQERLITEFPNLLLENCSGGGARFDPGMLYYSPQIWCSDDTDAIERLSIQEGTALVYPLSTMGAHVSVCPNHTVGRVTPFETRGHVALAGTFGYELDITKIDEAEQEMIPLQVAMYHKYNDLVREGDYYRIASYSENHLYDLWGVVSSDKKEALFTYVQVLAQANARSRKLLLQGLKEEAFYLLEGTERIYSGEELMYVGFLVEAKQGDFLSELLHFVEVDR